MKKQIKPKDVLIINLEEALTMTRQEPGLSIEEVAECIKSEFDIYEVHSLVKHLSIN